MIEMLARVPKITQSLASLAFESKQLYGIRHGEAWHNVMYDRDGPSAYSTWVDTSLTAKGLQQAASAAVPDVELVLVSPLTRALQTAALMYPNVPQIALEALKEYPQTKQVCNRRSSKSALMRCFPRVNFDDLAEEEGRWPNPQCNPTMNKAVVDVLVAGRPEQRIAIVAHSSWLKHYMGKGLAETPELDHCVAYALDA
tara:strand:+ start:1167 stop:1763 length:597 start_codon:yes stop_codon:yes gene_type:complete